MKIFSAILSTVLLVKFANADSFDSEPTETSNYDKLFYRLPSNIIPISYDIKLTVRLEEPDFIFQGLTEIKIHVFNSTKIVTLHASELSIEDAVIITGTGTNNTFLDHKIDNLTDFLTLNFNDELMAGQEYNLIVKYKGILKNEQIGFFRSSYQNNNNETIWLAATHFEPNMARGAFPCFDEPALKATFNISINHHVKYHALSNMHILETQSDPNDSDQQWTIFAKTPLMSTYLVAFVVSDFAKLENEASDFRIWARSDIIKYGKYALQYGQKAVKQMEEFTGIFQNDTRFIKIDNIALPELSLFAMENWGLITYQEKCLIANDMATIQDKIWVAEVITHEIVHQWFGNLVSPKYWNDLWLSESLTFYFHTFILDQIQPSWREMDVFVSDHLQVTAFRADEGNDYQALSKNDLRQITKDLAILYQKGASIIRMISHVITPLQFHKAIRNYLKKMSFKASSSDDLFDVLSAEYHKSLLTKDELKQAFNNWLDNPGFPVITVTRDYVNNTATITQERFFADRAQNISSHHEKYWIPINYAQAKRDFNETNITNWFKPTDTSIIISGLKNDQWVVFNRQQIGYYRINYDQQNWDLIIKTLNSNNYEDIHVLNRAQLINDALSLVQVSKLDHSKLLKLLSYLKYEHDFIPWKTAMRALFYMGQKLYYSKYWNKYKTFELNLFEDLERKVGFRFDSEEDFSTYYIRKNILQSRECYNTRFLKDYGYSRLKKWITNSTKYSLPKWEIVCAGMKNVSQAEWNIFFDAHVTNMSMKYALVCPSDKGILQGYLNMTLGTSINRYTKLTMFEDMLSIANHAYDLLLDFFIQHYKEIGRSIADDKYGYLVIEKILKRFKMYLHTPVQLEKLKAFARQPENVAVNGTNAIIEKLESRLELAKAVENDVHIFFSAQT